MLVVFKNSVIDLLPGFRIYHDKLNNSLNLKNTGGIYETELRVEISKDQEQLIPMIIKNISVAYSNGSNYIHYDLQDFKGDVNE